MPADSRSNGGAPSERLARLPHSGPPAEPAATVKALTVALGHLRQGATALKAENLQLRAEIEDLRLDASGRRGRGASTHEVGQLAEIRLPSDSRAPGAARLIIGHCLSGLVAPQALNNASLLATELVTNCVRHADLGGSDTVVVRVYLTAHTVRLEVENPGTAGVVAAKLADRQAGRGGFGLELVDVLAARWGVSRAQSTSVWLEMGRA